MAIETVCQGCNKRLRVADEYAGRTAKCPHCQTLYTVPQSPVAAAWGAGGTTDSPLSAADRWQMKTPDGLTFGPVARAELDRWLAEGRITPQSQILHEGDGNWVWAGQVYPQLQNFAANSPFKPGAPVLTTAVNPYASPLNVGWGPPGAGVRFREPHRGGAIIALAIVGIFVCDILSIVAVVMAIIDLGKMNRGEMDPSGKGLTIAGLVIGALKLVLIAVVLASMALFN